MHAPSRLIALVVVFLALAQPGVADTIHAMPDGGYYHHQSGWIFPDRIGDFALTGAAQDIDGTIDVVAYYARESKGVRTVASVSVYPPDSAAPETRPGSIKSTPVTVEVSKQPRLQATKLSYKDGKSTRATVYFIDTGAWIVKVRTSVPATDKSIGPIFEQFVRGQRWDSLQLSD